MNNTGEFSGKKNRILIVDDDYDFRRWVTNIFNKNGYDTDAACTRQVALTKLQESNFDLIIVDLGMPSSDMEIYDFIKTVRTINSKVHISIVTGDRIDSIHKAMDYLHEFRMSRYFLKPFEEDDLLVRVQQILNS